MKNDNVKVFLSKIKSKIESAEFDNELTEGFASRKLLYSAVVARIEKKIETKGTPVLSDSEIKECIKDVKEISLTTTALFLKSGILIKDSMGNISLSEKGKIAIKSI
jgi:hypothetical protein